LSLLMDALRRAEATNTAPRTDEAQPVAAPASVDLLASNGPLELQPMDAPLPDLVMGAATANEAGEPVSLQPADRLAEPAATRRHAQTVVGTFAARKSSLRKHSLFVLSGLVTAATILVGYYFWTSHDLAGGTAPTAARLIDMPASSSVTQTRQALTESVTPAVAGSVETVVTAHDPALAEASAGQQTPTTPASSTAHAAPAAEAQPYRIDIHKNRRPAKVPPALQNAYRAYRSQDYQGAEQLYREVLQTYPSNRDAMLGLAAIALHEGNRQVARYYYDRLLKNDPADKTALLGLQGLSAQQYSLEDGSKIKYWLHSDGQNAQLHFALGNQYAASEQWKEAQQAYFEAHRLEPANADYAFNLAVSLDQLGLGNQALDYYRQARNLAEKGGAMFSLPQLDQRIGQLAATTEKAR
jgi:Flp pilus assembly protein TadD